MQVHQTRRGTFCPIELQWGGSLCLRGIISAYSSPIVRLSSKRETSLRAPRKRETYPRLHWPARGLTHRKTPAAAESASAAVHLEFGPVSEIYSLSPILHSGNIWNPFLTCEFVEDVVHGILQPPRILRILQIRQKDLGHVRCGAGHFWRLQAKRGSAKGRVQRASSEKSGILSKIAHSRGESSLILERAGRYCGGDRMHPSCVLLTLLRIL